MITARKVRSIVDRGHKLDRVPLATIAGDMGHLVHRLMPEIKPGLRIMDRVEQLSPLRRRCMMLAAQLGEALQTLVEQESRKKIK